MMVQSNQNKTYSLTQLLQYLGAQQDIYDKKKWHTSKGVISITQEKFYNWNNCSGGGGAIDLIMHLKNYNFTSAKAWLSDNFFSHTTTSSTDRVKPPSLQLPARNDTALDRVVSYLSMKRNIPKPIITMLIDQGKLYADTHANAVFLLLGKNKMIVGAELRGTQGVKWLALALGSKKNLGCFYIKTTVTNKMVLCESAIDALSYYSINPHSIVLSTSGAHPHPGWLKNFVDKKFDIYCGFDADETGDLMAEKMIKWYPSIKRLRPQMHDWNDVLRLSSRRK